MIYQVSINFEVLECQNFGIIIAALIAQLRNTYAYIASYTARTYVPNIAS